MAIVSERPNDVLLCFSHLRWNFVHQRPQHLLGRAARFFKTFFVEEPIFEAGLSSPKVQKEIQTCGVTVIVPVLPQGMAPANAVVQQRAVVDELLAENAGARLALWYYTPMALTFSDHVAADLTIYDCMDELSGFRGAPPELVSTERRLFDRADLVFAGGKSLYEAKRLRHPNVHLFPSSVDKEFFAGARHAPKEPEDQAKIDRPRIGFFGVIDERMDIGLVGELADKRPDWQYVMIGPVVKIEADSLPRRRNIHWLGQRRYADLPAYLSGWQAGFMPFALNEATRFISPTKTPEFLAAGVPVVSTPVTDVVDPYGTAGLVEIADTADAFADALDHVMKRPRTIWLNEVDRYLAGLSWDLTWSRMLTLMDGHGSESRTSADTEFVMSEEVSGMNTHV